MAGTPRSHSARFLSVLAELDKAHHEDPERVEVDDQTLPWAVHYHARLAHWVAVLAPSASEPLRLAAQCQHIRRWKIPRGDYPAGPLGYKKWRSTLALFHADEAEAILAAAGYEALVIERVRALLVKKGLKTDPEVQLFEDAICLTFLENQLAAFSRRHDEDKLVGILHKTWLKMSPAGRAVASELAAALPEGLRAIVSRAVPDAPRGPFRSIVVGLDAEGRAVEAVRAALALAEWTGAELHLAHAASKALLFEPGGASEAEELDTVRARVCETVRELGLAAGVPLERIVQVRYGAPDDVLAAVAADLSADLVVVGPHQRHGIFDLHDTAKALLGRVRGALWDQMTPFRVPQRILAATDMSDASLAAVRIAVDLASAAGASVTVLHAFVPPAFAYDPTAAIATEGPNYVIEEERQRERAHFEHHVDHIDDRGVEVARVFVEAEAVDAILEQAASHDLVVLSTHGRTGLGRVLLGNVALRVMQRAATPVLAIRGAHEP
jgi:nucleotide-binding universal stress UspA family protein